MMATPVASSEAISKKQKLNITGDYSETKEEEVTSHCDVEDEESLSDHCDVEDEESLSEEEVTNHCHVEEEESREIAEIKKESLERWARYRQMTDEEEAEYDKRVGESGGFDVPYFPFVVFIGQIHPVSDSELEEESFRTLTDKALEKYNSDHHANYKLTKVVKATKELVTGFLCYITFEATADGVSAAETFRAKVYDGIAGYIEVVTCDKHLST